MSNEPLHLDPLEQFWMELKQAEKAGVFLETRVDQGGLVRSPAGAVTHRSWHGRLRFLPVAAALIFAVALWGWITHPTQDAQAGRHIAFHECFGGPMAKPMAACREHDYDADGDVDLADFSAYQSTFTTVTR